MDVVESLTKSFENFNLKEISVRGFMRNECNLSFKRVTLHPEERISEDKLQQQLIWTISPTVFLLTKVALM